MAILLEVEHACVVVVYTTAVEARVVDETSSRQTSAQRSLKAAEGNSYQRAIDRHLQEHLPLTFHADQLVVARLVPQLARRLSAHCWTGHARRT